MKKKFKQHFATNRRLTNKFMAFVYRSTFWVQFTMLAPVSKLITHFLDGFTSSQLLIDQVEVHIYIGF